MAFRSTVVACDLELKGFNTLKRALDPSRFAAALKQNVHYVNKQLALIGQDRLQQSIGSAKSWSVLNSFATIQGKGSSKPLTDRGDLWGNAGSAVIDPFQFVVGTNRTDKTGRYNLAWILHQGAHMPVTDGMRKYFRYLAHKTSGAVKPLSKNTKVLIIPARPFMRRAFIDDKSFMGMCSLQWRNAIDMAFRCSGAK